MKTQYSLALVAAALLAASTGCSQTGAVVRGQNPGVTQAMAYETQGEQADAIQPLAYPVKQLFAPGYHGHPSPPVAAAHELSDHIHEHVNATSTTYHSDAGFPGLDGTGAGYGAGAGCPTGSCPTGGCPSGAYGACPPGGGYGHCGNGGWLCHQRPPHVKHYNTYGYTVPRDLSYPKPNVPGGAVVYPYYTHKGPSDFFTK